MKSSFLSLLAGIFTLAISIASESANLAPPSTIEISSAFPETNPFSHVTNGQQNKLFVTFDNQGPETYTIDVVSAAFFDPLFTTLIQNLTAFKYGVKVPENEKVQVPFSFYSEFKPQELGLVVWMDFSDKEKNHFRAVAYNSTVEIVEPTQSIFDLQLLFLYVVLAALLLGGLYLIKQVFFPTTSQSKKKLALSNSKRASEGISSSITSPLSPGGYDESWIPEHHLKKPKAVKRKTSKKGGATSATSGEE